MTPRTSWAADLLGRLGFPISHGNLVGLVAWEMTEGGGFGNEAENNPLNTTQPEPGCWSINSVGVKAYPNYEEGMQATITTLRNGYYGGILNAFIHDEGPYQIANAVAASPWGTGRIADSTIQRADQEVGDTQPPSEEDMPLTQTDIDAVCSGVQDRMTHVIEDLINNKQLARGDDLAAVKAEVDAIKTKVGA